MNRKKSMYKPIFAVLIIGFYAPNATASFSAAAAAGAGQGAAAASKKMIPSSVALAQKNAPQDREAREATDHPTAHSVQLKDRTSNHGDAESPQISIHQYLGITVKVLVHALLTFHPIIMNNILTDFNISCQRPEKNTDGTPQENCFDACKTLEETQAIILQNISLSPIEKALEEYIC